MAKVIIQIPCYNEAGAIGVTLSHLPRAIPGIDQVEWLIIDDGSTDDTVKEAVAHGVDHVVRLDGHQGLEFPCAATWTMRHLPGAPGFTGPASPARGIVAHEVFEAFEPTELHQYGAEIDEGELLVTQVFG